MPEYVTLSADLLDKVTPQKKDHVYIFGGEHKGNQGVLIGIDGGDGIVKATSTLDIKIVELQKLAKLKSSSSTQ